MSCHNCEDCVVCGDKRPEIDFNEYQAEALKTASYTNRGDPTGELMYPVLGLCGETGEVAEKIKKFYRDGGDYETVRAGVEKELGDVLWYLTALAEAWHLTLEDVANANLVKLRSRRERGVIGGSGDNR